MQVLLPTGQVHVVVPPVCVAETNVMFVIVPSDMLAFVCAVLPAELELVTVTANVTLLPAVTKALFAGDVIATVMACAANKGDEVRSASSVIRNAPSACMLARRRPASHMRRACLRRPCETIAREPEAEIALRPRSMEITFPSTLPG